MALLNDNTSVSDGAARQAVVAANVTGVWVFSAIRGRKMSLTVNNPGGSTFDLVHYKFTEAQAQKGGFTRVKTVDESALSATQISRVSMASGVEEVGIEVTSATASPIDLELIFTKE